MIIELNCLLMRRQAWESVGGYDESMRRGYEDWEFNIRLGAQGYFGVVVPEPLFRYRVSETGMLKALSSRLHGQLWQDIQDRNPDLYIGAAIRQIRYNWRNAWLPYPVWMLYGLLWAHRLLPVAGFNTLFRVLLRRSASAKFVNKEA